MDESREQEKIHKIEGGIGMKWMIYGANGYTGELIARQAVKQGMTPVLAGRRADAIAKLGEDLSLIHI